MSKKKKNKKLPSLNSIIKKIGKKEFFEIVNEIDKMYPSEEVPKGWVKFNEHYPSFDTVEFVISRVLNLKVRDSSGREFYTQISDVLSWFELVKPSQDIVEWFNE